MADGLVLVCGGKLLPEPQSNHMNGKRIGSFNFSFLLMYLPKRCIHNHKGGDNNPLNTNI